MLVAVSSPAFGQETISDSLSSPLTFSQPSEYSVRLAFEHVLSLYDWQAETVFSQPTSSEHWFGYDVQLSADSRLRQETGLLTTSVTGLVTARRAVLGDQLLTPFVTLFGTSYAASTPPGSLPPPSLIRKQVDGFAVGGASTHLPSTSFALSAGAGVARQSQPFGSTYGSIFLASIDTMHEQIGDSTMFFADGGADERFFRERAQRYSNDRLSVRTISTFGEGHNVAALSTSLARRDFYFSTDSNSQPAKQERRELALLLMDSVRAPLFVPELSGIVSLEIEPHSITRRSDVPASQLVQTSSSALSTLLIPNDVSSFRIAALGGFDLLPRSNSLMMHGELRYEEHSEDVRLVSSEFAGADGAAVRKFAAALEQASFSSRVTSAALDSRYPLSANDTLSASVTSRLLNYDTPSQDNHDDHDDLVTGGLIGYGHRFSDDLNTSCDLRATRSHLVYLKSDRSSQNNVTRSVTFSTAAAYTGANWMSQLYADVFANYTVLDYLDSLPILQSVGSYVIRGMTLHDTTRISTGRVSETIETAFETSTDLRVSERGTYNESAFSERRSTRVTELTTTAVLNVASWFGPAPWLVKMGGKGFFLFRDGETTGTLLSGQTFGELERQTRFGPYAELQLRRSSGEGPMLLGSIWYSILRAEQSTSATIYTTPKVESHLEIRWIF